MGQAFPLIAGLALTAGGTAANMAANNKVKKRSQGYADAEMRRQKGYKEQAWNTFQQGQSGVGADTAQQQIEEGAAERAAISPSISSGTYDMSKEPLMKGSGSYSSDSDFGKEMAAKYRLGGLSDWQLNDMIRNMNTNAQLNITSRKAQNSANILPYELQDAQYAGDGLRSAGGIMSGLGAMLGLYGALKGIGAASSGLTGAQKGAAAAGMGPMSAKAAGQWAAPLGWQHSMSMYPVGTTSSLLNQAGYLKPF